MCAESDIPQVVDYQRVPIISSKEYFWLVPAYLHVGLGGALLCVPLLAAVGLAVSRHGSPWLALLCCTVPAVLGVGSVFVAVR